jgi:hypothetical protein
VGLPLGILFFSILEVARKVFNYCTTISKASQEFEVIFDYEFLDDTYHLGTWKKHQQGRLKNQPMVLPDN